MKELRKRLDPRAGLIALLMANLTVFSFSSIYVVGVLVIFISCIMCYFKIFKTALKFIFSYIILFALQSYILPNSPRIIAMTFSIFVNYALKMLPCLMVGMIMIKNISMEEMIAGFRKMHCPESFLVSLSITLRYFPAVKEEIHYINDAMKLKRMNFIQKATSIIIPLMISATNTIDELSKAAVTRGIDNPVKKTSVVELKLKLSDYMISLVLISIFVYFKIVF